MQPGVTSGVTYREVGALDGEKIAALGEQTPDTGAVAFHNLWHYDPYVSILALHGNAVGVVAEAAGHDGIVGLGMMKTGECLVDGALRPYAYLFSLSVHPAYRRRGIASQLAEWRIEKARKLLGEDVVIFAGIQQGNEGSLRNAAKWSNQRIDGRTTAGIAKMRTSPPLPITGLWVRPAEAGDFEEIAEKQNRFYAEHNLYVPRTAAALQAWHNVAPFGTPLRNYFVVTDQARNIVAGMSATDEGLVTTGHVARMVLPMRLLNYLLRVIPADGTTKRIVVKDLWFAPGRIDAAKYLWELVRWLWRERGTMLMSLYDIQSPMAPVIPQPWYMPRQSGSLVIAAPTPVNETKPLYMHI